MNIIRLLNKRFNWQDFLYCNYIEPYNIKYFLFYIVLIRTPRIDKNHFNGLSVNINLIKRIPMCGVWPITWPVVCLTIDLITCTFFKMTIHYTVLYLILFARFRWLFWFIIYCRIFQNSGKNTSKITNMPNIWYALRGMYARRTKRAPFIFWDISTGKLRPRET